MNKISKKIVALVTMAAFVLTLVPAAAFAANADLDTSNYKVEATSNAGELAVTVNVNGKGSQADNATATKVQIKLFDSNGNAVTKTTDPNLTCSGATDIDELMGAAGEAPSSATQTYTFKGLKDSDTYTAEVQLDTTGSAGLKPINADGSASAYVIAAADY